MQLLIETIKIDSGFPQHLDYHQERMDRSVCDLSGRRNNFRLDKMLEIPKDFRKGICKCRVTYNNEIFFAEYQPYRKKRIERLKVVEADIDYSYKYKDRSEIEKLLSGRNGCDDILIVRKGLVTDISYANIVFANSKGLFTPAKPLLSGTAVARLINTGILSTCDITLGDLCSFDYAMPVNAMLELWDVSLPASCIEMP